jgi:hypothetical protein
VALDNARDRGGLLIALEKEREGERERERREKREGRGGGGRGKISQRTIILRDIYKISFVQCLKVYSFVVPKINVYLEQFLVSLLAVGLNCCSL